MEFGGKVFYFYKGRSLFWFRFFDGYGILGKNYIKRGLLFSERSNRTFNIKIGNWMFKFLKPNKK